jgi:biopolymer transport protein ExbD
MQIKALPSKRPRVEMIPLIDMFFLLLVFFIFGVFSMTMQQGIVVELPSAKTAQSSRELSLTVSLTPDGQTFLNQRPVTRNELAEALQHERVKRPDAQVVINADRQVPHGAVITVLDAVREAGLQRVSFQTEPATHER